MPVRLATTADADALVHVINRAYRVESHIFHGQRTDAADIHQRLRAPNVCFLVVDDDEAATPRRLAGAVYVETCGDRGYFGMLSVDPDRQGRGLGRTLVAAAEARALAAGSAFMDLDVVDQRGELADFYGALGYVVTGSTPYGNEAATKVPVVLIRMSKPLRSSVPSV